MDQRLWRFLNAIDNSLKLSPFWMDQDVVWFKLPSD